MGGLSTVPVLQLTSSSIKEIDNTKVIYIADDHDLKVLYFNDEIKDDCFRILTEAKKSHQDVTIDYYNWVVLGIQLKGESQMFISSCLSPTSFGYVLKKNVNNLLETKK